jgi:transcriptional regulator with XRE-family HTH domain
MGTLKEARLAKFLSQQDLAEKSKVGRSTIATIESGTPPRLRTARLLAAALDVDPRDIDWPGSTESTLEHTRQQVMGEEH